MEGIVGILKVRIIKGINLAIRDLRSSDPYVIVRLGDQKVKTRVIKHNLNPIWDEELSVVIPHSSRLSLKLEVYDKDMISKDDKMGDALVDLEALASAAKMRKRENTGLSEGKLWSSPAKEGKSVISCVDGHMVQDVRVKLQHVESGELELQIKWVDTAE